ncbi:uncharacterized protein BT62DRAFT_999111 [Guyanagaster necrorhizus]|uniref:Uncharacterized protein n=1 Tax=Guyanagaster necrorhizus TaxID=856835 RepID=A0A9P7W5P7_9AGAR|nr:uncharacterized protein BT62DRAFT_999111 [Guyanagaster necrorhizus MCA 3950]KAG7453077.1 hypothetical protein BT62DRAFT_999111 [Guyanagaster necrorhizus MCA 3950]
MVLRRTSCQADETCSMLANLLANRVPEAYTMVLVNRCPEFFGNHVFDMASNFAISQYVAGTSIMLHGSNGDAKNMATTSASTLTTSMNLTTFFAVCCISWPHVPLGDVQADRRAIYTDGTLQYPKLHKLTLGKDGGDFFAQQQGKLDQEQEV